MTKLSNCICYISVYLFSNFATVSIVTITIMCYLLISETQEAFFGERKICKVGIDSAREGHTQIHLDFDVLGMDCTEFGFDVTDKAGDLMLDATNDQNGRRTLKKNPLPGCKNPFCCCNC